MSFQRMERPLSDPERRMLRWALARLSRERARASRSALWASALACGVLWSLTLLASREAFRIVTAFWAAIWVLMSAWMAWDRRRTTRARAAVLQAAIQRDRVEDLRVTASAMIEMEEVEDLGACYAFQIEPERILFLRGQELYAGQRFPSTDFSLATLTGPGGEAVAEWIVNRGRRLRPDRLISAKAQASLRFPGHVEQAPGTLSEVEMVLRAG